MKKTFWLLPLVIAIPLLAVTPQFWETRSYEDFRHGKLTDISLTSDSELILAPRLNSVFNTEQTLIFSAVSDSKGNVYLGTGHEGKVFRVDSAGHGTMIADLAELDVSALAVDSKGTLFAATSPDGKIYRIDGATTASPAVKEYYRPDAKYIWALAFDKQGQLLAATGDKGIIYRISGEGKGEPFYSTDETHVISLAVDKDGNVIAGGDPKGYIYRITPDGKKAFVLYDSGMREVHTIVLGANGNIYAAVLSGRPGFMNSTPTTATPSSTGAEPTVNVTIRAAEAAGQTIEVVDTPDQTPVVSKPSGKHNTADTGAQTLVLEIQPDGTVNTLWRSNDEMVFSLLPRSEDLLISTGTKGRIYSLSLTNTRNVTLLAESTEEQTTRLLEAGRHLYAATANIGKLFAMDDSPSGSGTYESVVRDTEATSTWGRIALKGQNTNLVQIATRSGNTSSPDKTWSDWTTVDANGTPASPKARFIQWKATLKADKDRLPRLNSVTVPYLQQNFRPEVTSIEVMPPGVALIKTQTFNANGTPTGGNDPAAARASARAGQAIPPRIPPRKVVQKGAQSFQWTATDRNDDYLTYDVYYRGEDEKTWRLLKKDVEDNFYTINSETLPDGTYQLRVIASDQQSNPPDLALTGETESRPFTIDNTPPVVNMKLEGIDKGRARIAIEAVDTTSTLNQAEVSVDTGDWRPIFPNNGIIDAKTGLFSYVSSQLTSGEHVIAFRVYDQNDNVGMQKLIVRIP